jgi:two-component system, sensor histidine kinase and response regulator
MPRRFLIVEDSPTQAAALLADIESAGHAGTVVASGVAALEELQRAPFDLVLSDVIMPGAIDGYELCSRIKAQADDPPVILLTQLSDTMDVIHALECGADAFLTKPCDIQHLLERVNAILAARGARRQGGSDDGVELFFGGKAFTIRADQGRVLDLLVTTYAGAVRKNTELQQRERELTDAKASLARYAAQLEATNQELEAFTYSVSHDLRTPLRAIDGFSRLLLEEHAGQLDPEGQRLLGIVRENTGRMGALIADLLELSRVGRRALEVTEVAMDPLVGRIVAGLTEQHAPRELRFTLGPLAPAWCDAGLIDQVWENLLANAVKFSLKRDPPTIDVHSEVKGGEVVYTVADNGAGFDMAHAGKLFRVFERLHRQDEFAGTGVGLAIVDRVVRRHGGRVWGSGVVDGGATFSFSLPRRGALP